MFVWRYELGGRRASGCAVELSYLPILNGFATANAVAGSMADQVMLSTECQARYSMVSHTIALTREV